MGQNGDCYLRRNDEPCRPHLLRSALRHAIGLAKQENWSAQEKVLGFQRVTLTASDFANEEATVSCEILVDGQSASARGGRRGIYR